MNKAKMNTTRWSITSPQQSAVQSNKAVYVPVAVQNLGESTASQSALGSSCGINVRRMVEDAFIIREQKANAGKTSELSGTRTIEPTGIFNKRASERAVMTFRSSQPMA